MALPWFALLLAGLFEIVWAFTMKLSAGFTKPGPTALTLLFMGLSVSLLSLAMRTLPLGTAYTIWTGIGAVRAFTVGILILGESASPSRLLAALLIVSGIVLMKLSA